MDGYRQSPRCLPIFIFLIYLRASGALNARQNDTQPVQTEAPVQTVEPAQNTPEAVQSEPARPGKKVNMDDTKWADAIEELNDYIDQQIGGDKK